MITKEQRQELVAKFGKTPQDSGSTAVQIALLTLRIQTLAPHFEANKKDHHSKLGLLKMIGQRKALLRYLAASNPEQYRHVLKELNIRK